MWSYGCIDPTILNRGTIRKWVESFTLQRLDSRINTSDPLWIRGQLGLRTCLEALDDRKICATTENRTWIPGYLSPYSCHTTLFELYGDPIGKKPNTPKPLVRTRNAKCNRKSFSSFQNGTQGRTCEETVTSYFGRLTMKMKALWSFEMERTAHPKTQLYFRADFLYSAAPLWESQISQQKHT